MSSILTNTSAMVALQTMKGLNANMNKVQSEISTGKSVNSSKDNAAVWAISKVMESEVKGFKGISDSLAMGESSISVARNATETITGLLTEIKGKVVSAQEENVDRSKIQTDITQLKDQIKLVIGAAQFNGLNLIDGSSTDKMKLLSSLDRDAQGNFNASYIEVDRQNLAVSGASNQTFGATDLADAAAAGALIKGTGDTIFDDTAYDPTAGTGNMTSVAANGTEAITIGQVAEGASYQIQIQGLEIQTADGNTATGTRTFEYVATAKDGTADVAKQLADQMTAFFAAATNAGYTATVSNDNQITIRNGTGGSAPGAIEVGVRAQTDGTAGSSAATGGLGALETIDVTDATSAAAALTAVEGLIQTSIDASAAFGSAQKRIGIQSDFVSKLTDSLTAGIGTLVDADLEAASARLQALQVQQQLATQALSIANQQPQNLLSLFR